MSDTMLTGEEVCTFISHVWKRRFGIDVPPEDIWNYSPRGELFMVFAWYWTAKDWADANPE